MLKNDVEVSNRWKGYFEGVSSVKDDRAVEVNYLELGCFRNEKSEGEIISKEEGRQRDRTNLL